MPSSSIAQILLRIFALNWLLLGLIQIASMGVALRQGYFSVSNLIAPSAVYFVAGTVVWAIAPRLSRFLAGRNDGGFDFRGMTETQLYAAVFLGLGLYFALTSFGNAFSWVHFFAVNRPSEHGVQREGSFSYYEMSETLLTFAAGIFLVLTCKTWARKLGGRQRGEQGEGGDRGYG